MKKAFVSFAILLAITITCYAQDNNSKFAFELRGEASLATQKLSDVSLKTGLGFEGIFHYNITGQLGAYAGWGWHHFSPEQSSLETDFEETGYLLGLQYKYPIGSSPISLYMRAGGIYDHIEIENSNGEITHDTGHGLGYQIGTGVYIPIGNHWELVPCIKYQSLSRDLEINNITTGLDLRYFSCGIGIMKSF